MPVDYNRYDKEIIELLEQLVLPWWEQFGLSHLCQSAGTLAEFNKQRLPEQIKVSIKKRQGKKVATRRVRHLNNIDQAVAAWPQDHQMATLYPRLICVLKGQADLHIADYAVHCPQSHFLLYRPNVPFAGGHTHLIKRSPDDNLEQRYAEILWFSGQTDDEHRIRLWTCHSQGDRHWAKPRFDFCFIERSEVMQSYHLFIHELMERAPGYQGIAHAAFLAFLRLFIRELKLGHFHYGGTLSSPEAANKSTSTIEIAQHYINRHLNQHLTTANIADVVYMSRASFVRQFREETGQTFNQYVTARRLEEAQRFLSQGNWRISEIGQFVGLKPAQLRNLFLKHLGTSPSAYRQLQNNRQK